MPFSSELLEVVLETPSLTRQMPLALGVNQQSFIENPVKKEETEQDQDAEDEEEEYTDRQTPTLDRVSDDKTKDQDIHTSSVGSKPTLEAPHPHDAMIGVMIRRSIPTLVKPCDLVVRLRYFGADAPTGSGPETLQRRYGPAGNDDPEKRKVEG
ncbi:MAG: hypothetical protein Q9194_002038 [Teloschistes cf. exilis]